LVALASEVNAKHQRRHFPAASRRRSHELTARRSTAARGALVTLVDWWLGTRRLLIQCFEAQQQFEGNDIAFGGAANCHGCWRADAGMAVAFARPDSNVNGQFE
jgi:hypothetical protein